MTVLEFRAPDGKAPSMPHNIEAEQALLGAIFINNEAFHAASEIVTAGEFYEDLHRQVFEICAQLVRVGKAATPVSVKTYLPDEIEKGLKTSVYLARLAGAAATIVNARDYAQLIRDCAQRRGLVSLAADITQEALYAGPDLTPAVQIEEVEKRLFALAERQGTRGGFVPFNQSLTKAIEMAAAAYSRDGTLSGLATGLIDLDRIMGGLQKSDLIIIAGRPAMGKTALGTNIAYHIASAWQGQLTPGGQTETSDGGQVAFFSLEMSAEQLATRILSGESGISSSDIRRGNIHESKFGQLVDVSNRMTRLPLWIDDSGGLSVSQLATRARRLKRQRGLDVIVVDYLQLLSGDGQRRNDNRVQEMTQITTALKALAKELDVPIIALSQLSRAVESREDKHPQLSDLRESGSIEQDADVVLFVYREEYYLKNTEPKEGTEEHLGWQHAMEKAAGRAEVIIGKQRHGPTGTVQLSFDSKLTMFGNLARGDYLPERME